MLAVRLLLEEGRAVSTDRLCEDLWAGRPSSRAVASLHAHISRLRVVLEPGRPPHGKSGLLVRESHGYALHVPFEARDTFRFEQGVAKAGRSLSAGRVKEARREIEHALSLWRGAALEDARDHLFAARQAAQLEEGRVAAEELRICTLMHDGDVKHAVGAAEALTKQYPLREVAWGLLLCALYLTGRHAEALARFEELRKHLSEELGLQPSPSVSSLQEAILCHDLGFIRHTSRSIVTSGYDTGHPSQALDIGVTDIGSGRSAQLPGPAAADPTEPEARGTSEPAACTVLSPGRSALRPAQLPSAPAYFTGRRAELDTLAGLLPESSDHGAVDATARVTVIGGAPGVGKTTLALRFAHRIAERFPDGQLFADLRGFDPSHRAAEPAEILQRFLVSLGVSSAALPSCTTARTALLRTLLSGRRVLFVLDNARDEEQVRPLLPGTFGCMVVVTSRNQLQGLVTMEGAAALTLDVPPVADSRAVLARRLGTKRVAAEPQAVEEIIKLCARLPLALAIAAARATLHPDFSLRALAEEMRATDGSLDAFIGSDGVADVRAVFSWSYRALAGPAARLFRLLALHPGPEVSTAAAASLAALPVIEARRLLTNLTRTRLVNEPSVGRFVLHDLLRVYAWELAQEHETEETRAEARTRLYDHYLLTASAGEPSLCHTPRPALSQVAAGVVRQHLPDTHQLMAWYATELPVLRTVLRQAADAGYDKHAAQLAWRLQGYLDAQGRSSEAASILSVALEAAERADDRVEQARLHRALAGCLARSDRYTDAMSHLEAASDLLESADEPVEQALVHLSFAALLHSAGHNRPALDKGLEALALAGRCSDPVLEADACNAVGWVLSALGRHVEALDYCRRSVASFRRIGGVVQREAFAWDSLGHIHHHLGDHQQAITCYRNALNLMEAAGDSYTRVGTLLRLGDTHLHTADRTAARTAWALALKLAEEHPEVHRVPEIKERLTGLAES